MDNLLMAFVKICARSMIFPLIWCILIIRNKLILFLEDYMNAMQSPGTRTWLLGVVGVVLVAALIFVIISIGLGSEPAEGERVDALANSKDDCVVCHRKSTPGIVDQYGHSTMAAAEVSCQ